MESVNQDVRGRRLSAALVLSGLALGGAAVAVVRTAPWLGLLLFIAGGALIGAQALRDPTAGRLSPRPEPRRGWEPAFVLLLLVLAAWPRMVGLNDRPAGAGGHEGELVSQMYQFETRKDFVIHIQDADINWPSLTVYQALAFKKLMGAQPAAYRMESAVWGLLAVLALYFALRALFSPVSAAGASLMLGGSFYHLVQSRMFFPGTILNFSAVAALAFWVAATRRRSAAWAAAAGVAAGLSLWGFIPGRGVPGFFAVWFLFIGLDPASRRPERRFWLAFFGGLILMAAPVIYYALRWPQFYWGYVSSMNPNRGRGLLSYLHWLFTESRNYFRLFHIQGDVDPGMGIPLAPLVDPVTGLLFPLGLFAALACFWRPANSFMIGLFLAGMLPAVMGAGFAHPTTRRIVLAWPAVFLLSGYVFERVRVALNPGRGARRDLALLALFAAVGGASYAMEVGRYFTRFYEDPRVQAHVATQTYRIYKDHLSMPDSRLVASPMFGGVVWSVYFPMMEVTQVWEPEDILRLPDDRAIDAYIDPIYAEALPLFRAAIPGLEAEVVPSPHYPEVNVGKDPFAPETLYVHLRIPAGKLREARGAELDGRRVDPFDQGFAAPLAGKAVSLRASLLAPRSKATARLRLGWPGFDVRLDGRPVPLGAEISLEGGLHELRLSGRVPAGASGPLPLSLDEAGVGGSPLLYPLRWDHGVVVTWYSGKAAWDSSPPRFSRRWAVPIYRFHDIYEVFIPFSVRVRAVLTPAESGRYRFVARPWTLMRILVDGRVVHDSVPGEKPVDEAFGLRAGQSVSFEALHDGFPGGALERVVQFRWVRDGEPPESAVPVPVACFSTGPRQGWSPGPMPAAKP